GRHDTSVGASINECATLAQEARAQIDGLEAPVDRGGVHHDFAGDDCFDPFFGLEIPQDRLLEPETTIRLADSSAVQTATIQNYLRRGAWVLSPAGTVLHRGQTVSATWNRDTDDLGDLGNPWVEIWAPGKDVDAPATRSGKTLTFQLPADMTAGSWTLS